MSAPGGVWAEVVGQPSVVAELRAAVADPAAMTHASAAGSPLEISPSLVRVSVGVETAADLVADLRAALDSVVSPPLA